MKRVLDMLCSFFLLIILSPLFLIIACAIRFTSLGPVMYRSSRVGLNGAKFVMFKFRTMNNGSGKPGEIIKKGDCRITAIGRFLRSMYLDELPQLWNILRGEMSLVGPRPYTAELSAIRLKENRRFYERFKVTPGLTGLEQIHGRDRVVQRGSKYVLALDLYYIRRRNLLLDLLILLQTIVVVLKRKGI